MTARLGVVSFEAERGQVKIASAQVGTARRGGEARGPSEKVGLGAIEAKGGGAEGGSVKVRKGQKMTAQQQAP